MKTLENKIVAITGAGSGFGRAVALEVARRKAIPILLDVNEAGLAETASLLNDSGTRSMSHPLDVRSVEQWAAVVAKILGEFGQADALINNAGVMCRPESFLDVAEDHGRFIFDVNFWGMVHGMRAFAPHLAKRPEANIVNVASTLALIGSPMHGVYCASKAALAQMTHVVRQELAGTSICVSTVYPGPSKTNLGRNVPVNDEPTGAARSAGPCAGTMSGQFMDPHELAAHREEQRKKNAANFEKFAVTTPEAVAKKIASAILHDKAFVTTSADGVLTQVLQRLAPVGANSLMGRIYRRISDPKQFETLEALKP